MSDDAVFELSIAALLHEGMPGDVRDVVSELALLVQRLVDHRAHYVRDPSERGTGGNVIGFMGVDLRTDVRDAYERFEAIHDAARAAKADAKASDVRIPRELMDAIPGGIMTMAVRVTSAPDLRWCRAWPRRRARW